MTVRTVVPCSLWVDGCAKKKSRAWFQAHFCRLLLAVVLCAAGMLVPNPANAFAADERPFVLVGGGLWTPSVFGNFEANHRTGPLVALEAGMPVWTPWDGPISGVVDLSVSHQRLADALDASDTTMIYGAAGLRWTWSAWDARGSGLYATGTVGLVFETAPREDGHDAPKGEATGSGGLGIEERTASGFLLGLRADWVYFQEYGAAGWFQPTVYAGTTF